ncbi:MAG: DinB family protein [Thermomicrobiales bacterium]
MDANERAEAIARYRHGPAALRAAYAASPAETRQWRPAPDAWSIHEIIVHCADSEANAYTRIRMLMAEENPTIVGYDQDAWAGRFDYHARPVETAFSVIESVHAHTAELLPTFSEDDWTRTGTHSERGSYSAEDWLRDYSEHLFVHVDQIEANVASWEAHHASTS